MSAATQPPGEDGRGGYSPNPPHWPSTAPDSPPGSIPSSPPGGVPDLATFVAGGPLPVALPSSAHADDRWVLGVLVRIIVDGNHVNGGVYDLIEVIVGPGAVGPPPHLHQHTTEHLLVVDGGVDLLLGGRTRRLAAGEICTVEPNTVHTWDSVSRAPCRVLIVTRPSGMVRFYRLAGTPIQDAPGGPPPVTNAAIAHAASLAVDVHVQFVTSPAARPAGPAKPARAVDQ